MASFWRSGSSLNRFQPARMNSMAMVAEKTGVTSRSLPMLELAGMKKEFGT